jgi:hypothetical protein
MKIKFIDEKTAFSLNPSMNISTVEIENTKIKIVIVDDFYAYPDLVRDITLSIPPTKSEKIMMSLPGYRIDVCYDLSFLGKFYDDLIIKEFLKGKDLNSNVENIFRSATFCVNLMHQKDLTAKVPHVDSLDSLRFASTIYLNTPEECQGGTAFYTYKGSPYFREIPKHVDKYIYDDHEDWKMIYLAEMKYNRMILYKQNILHSAYISPRMYNDDFYRIVQMFFI